MIAEAYDELGNRALIDFYEQIGLDRHGSTARKMRNVGKKKARFEPHTHLLPNNWTTLSYLAQLTDNQYQKLVDGSVLHSSVTLQTIKDNIATSSKPRPRPERVVIDFTKVEDTGRPAFATKLKKLLKEYKILSEETQAPTLDKFIGQGEAGGAHA